MFGKYRNNMTEEGLVFKCLKALGEKNMEDFISKINSILLEELNADYISFFSIVKDNILAIEYTNIRSTDIKHELEKILKFEDASGQDFRGVFLSDGNLTGNIIALENDTPLLYPSAFHRKIRSSIFITVKGIGFFLVEDNRKIVTEAYVDMLDTAFKQLKPALLLFKKQFYDEILEIPTYSYLEELYRDVVKSIVTINITNIQGGLTLKHGPVLIDRDVHKYGLFNCSETFKEKIVRK